MGQNERVKALVGVIMLEDKAVAGSTNPTSDMDALLAVASIPLQTCSHLGPCRDLFTNLVTNVNGAFHTKHQLASLYIHSFTNLTLSDLSNQLVDPDTPSKIPSDCRVCLPWTRE